MIDAGGIEQPDTWEAGPKFGQEAMLACPACKTATRHFGSTQQCPSCFAEWHRNGNLKRRPPEVPDGCLFVYEDEELAPNEIPALNGTGIQRGNIIEF